MLAGDLEKTDIIQSQPSADWTSEGHTGPYWDRGEEKQALRVQEIIRRGPHWDTVTMLAGYLEKTDIIQSQPSAGWTSEGHTGPYWDRVKEKQALRVQEIIRKGPYWVTVVHVGWGFGKDRHYPVTAKC